MTPKEPYTFPGQGLEVLCPCGHQFWVPKSLRGGIVNCPSCHKAVDVPRGARPELLFWLCVAGFALPVFVVASSFFVSGDVAGGWITIAIGVVVVGAIVLAM